MQINNSGRGISEGQKRRKELQRINHQEYVKILISQWQKEPVHLPPILSQNPFHLHLCCWHHLLASLSTIKLRQKISFQRFQSQNKIDKGLLSQSGLGLLLGRHCKLLFPFVMSFIWFIYYLINFGPTGLTHLGEIIQHLVWQGL